MRQITLLKSSIISLIATCSLCFGKLTKEEMDLFYYIKQDNIKQVTSLLNKRVNPNIKNNEDSTPLFYALKKNRKKIFELLLQHGADPNIADLHGNTPLHFLDPKCAAAIEFAKLLIAFGADPNKQNHNGQTPLHKACANGYKEIVELLIQFGGDLALEDHQSITPLMLVWERMDHTNHSFNTQMILQLIYNSEDIVTRNKRLALEKRQLHYADIFSTITKNLSAEEIELLKTCYGLNLYYSKKALEKKVYAPTSFKKNFDSYLFVALALDINNAILNNQMLDSFTPNIDLQFCATASIKSLKHIIQNGADINNLINGYEKAINRPLKDEHPFFDKNPSYQFIKNNIATAWDFLNIAKQGLEKFFIDPIKFNGIKYTLSSNNDKQTSTSGEIEISPGFCFYHYYNRCHLEEKSQEKFEKICQQFNNNQYRLNQLIESCGLQKDTNSQRLTILAAIQKK